MIEKKQDENGCLNILRSEFVEMDVSQISGDEWGVTKTPWELLQFTGMSLKIHRKVPAEKE